MVLTLGHERCSGMTTLGMPDVAVNPRAMHLGPSHWAWAMMNNRRIASASSSPTSISRSASCPS
eukprot:1688651-Lingulodinium_polyedra.AAC.1